MSHSFLDQFRLTPAERDIVSLASRDVPRAEIMALRGVKPSTLKKQVQVILGKTKARSLDHLALRVVLFELSEVQPPHVCPGCHAVGSERCAPDCIDAQMRRESFDWPTDEDERELAAELGEPEEDA